MRGGTQSRKKDGLLIPDRLMKIGKDGLRATQDRVMPKVRSHTANQTGKIRKIFPV